jgi:hypothetical protein
MPYYCRICGRSRRNEKFSGRGHRIHICKDCQRLPREQRDRIERMDELYGFLEQSNISPKNIARLEILAQHASRYLLVPGNLGQTEAACFHPSCRHKPR